MTNTQELPNVPSWMVSLMPDVRTPCVLSYNGEKYVVAAPDGIVSLFDSCRDAYKTCSDNVIVDTNVPEYGPFGVFLINDEGPRSNSKVMLFPSNDQDRVEDIRLIYKDFLTLAERYKTDSSNFMKSYNFVINHPAFWFKKDAEPSFWWEHSYSQKVWMEPTTDDNGNIVWMLEAGSRVLPGAHSHYHDMRLDVYAPTVEDGYVQLAALVHKFFHLDGTERENVDYEPSEDEVALREAIAEHKASLSKSSESLEISKTDADSAVSTTLSVPVTDGGLNDE